MLAVGADANEFECQTARCRTPLIAAAQGGRCEALKLLLARGADVNKKMKPGQTALMFASYYGHTETVRLLLTSGADVHADFEGDTALSWAKQKGHGEIVDLLTATAATRYSCKAKFPNQLSRPRSIVTSKPVESSRRNPPIANRLQGAWDSADGSVELEKKMTKMPGGRCYLTRRGKN